MSSDFNLSDQTNRTWQDRAELCAALIGRICEPGKRISLADVGCGDMKLRNALRAEGLQVDYFGFDLLPQADEVRPFNLDRDHLPCEFDIVTVLGVIEYLHHVRFALQMIAEASRHFVFSYMPSNLSGFILPDAARLGWSNCMCQTEVEAMLQAICVTVTAREITPDGRTMLWLCNRR